VAQGASDQVGNQESTHISHMGISINCGPARVDAGDFRVRCLDGINFSGHRVVEPHPRSLDAGQIMGTVGAWTMQRR
jgi:hypothetical protein